MFSTEASQIEMRIAESEAKQYERDDLEHLLYLLSKISSYARSMQELDLNYPTT
jgi:hypothetical protein